MDEKRKMQEMLNHSLSGLKENPFLSQRLIAQAKGEEPVKKKFSISVIVVIALLLIGTVAALAAGVEDINAMLYKLWPEAARALRPLNLSVENDGIRLDVISATMSDDHVLITYSLTDLEENRINDKTECSANVSTPFMVETYSSNRMISSDITNHQTVYATYYEYSPIEYPENIVFGDANTIQFTVNGVINPAITVVDLWPLMKNQDYKVESVPGPDKTFQLDLISSDEKAKKDKLPNVLNPVNSLHIPITDGVELSGIGWIDGMMHVQIHISNYIALIETDNSASFYARYLSYIDLHDHQGNYVWWRTTELLKDSLYFVCGISWQDGNDLWMEKIFPIQPEEIEKYVIYCEITDQLIKSEELYKSEWSVSFPTNMIQVEKSE